MSRIMLRHLLATLAYRAAKVLRDAPVEFGEFQAGPAARRPVQIVAHMGDLMSWGITLARGEHVWKAEGSGDWDIEVKRFLDRPLTDALTHVGQLAILRGLAGCPVRPESYARAEIVVGRVGLVQSAPVREFDGDASLPK